MLKQIVRLILMLWGITVLAFVFFEVAQTTLPSEDQTGFTHFENYQIFMSSMLEGDFGTLHQGGEPVLTEFFHKLPASTELIFTAIIIAWLVGLPLALLAVKKPMGITDRTIQLIGTTIYSLPVFWWGIILLIMFATGLEWFPVGGRLDYIYAIETVTGSALIDTLLSSKVYAQEAFWDAVYRMVLPVTTLAMLPTAYVTLQIRAGMEEILQHDYMKSAKARGMSIRRILWLHGLPNAVQPVLNSMSMQFSMLVTSTIIVEFIFSWPGIGHWFLILIQRQDYDALRGALILIASMILLLNTTTDVLRYWSNPRLRR